MNTPNIKEFQLMMDENLLSTNLSSSSEDLMALFGNKLSKTEANDEAKLRLAIYRNNVIHSLSSALGDLYPVIKKLIGDDCFNAAAIEFVRIQPPQHAALLHYGKSFNEFIIKFEACKHLNFLSDVATLEFEYNQAYHSADIQSFDPQTLSAIAPEQLGELRFSCHPSLSLIPSIWPIDDIWHENQKEQPELIDLDHANGVHLLIYRLGLVVQLVNLDENCFIFLQHLKQGMTINQAWLETINQAELSQRQLEPEELSGMLGYLFSLEVFTAFNLSA